MTELILKVATKLARISVSCVSWIVVKIRDMVPAQFSNAVTNESCPVVPLRNVVITCVTCKEKRNV